MAESKLVVKLVAENAKLHRELDRSNAKIRKFSQTATKHTALVAKAFAGIGVALVIRQFAMLTKEALATGDALAKTAAKLGLTTEALSGLQRAAQLTGVESRTLDMAIQRMTRRLSEAAMGTGEAKAALKELGLSAKELNALSPDQAFMEIAGAMSEVKNQSDKVRLSFKLFDSEGVALVNTLALGKEGLEQTAAQAKYLGVAVSGETVKKMEAFNDSMLTLHQSMLGAANIIIEYAGPALTAFINTVSLGIPIFVEKFAGGIKTVNMDIMELTASYYHAIATISQLALQASFTDVAKKQNSEIYRNALEKELELRIKIQESADELLAISNKIAGKEEFRDKFSFSKGASVEAQAASERVSIEQETNQEVYDMRANHINALNKLMRDESKKGETAQTRQWKEGWEGKTKILSESMSAVGGLMMQGSKKQFEIGKKLNMAAAIANTAQAVTSALATPPFPLGLALATTAAAVGLAQIQAIRGTSFQGGGSVSTPGGGFSTATPSYNMIQSPEIETPSSNVTININALDTQSGADVINANRGLITSIVQKSQNEQGKRL